jgi:tRNA(fMet)-specific endonuclease VapC
MLDTNICIFLIKNSFPKLSEKLVSHPAKDIGLSTIAVSELYYGISKSSSKKNIGRLASFLAPFIIVDFDTTAAMAYGVIRSNLENRGQTIGPYDMQIAAHALSLDLTLITNNTKEFRRVDNLLIEDWSI